MTATAKNVHSGFLLFIFYIAIYKVKLQLRPCLYFEIIYFFQSRDTLTLRRHTADPTASKTNFTITKSNC